MGSSLLSRIKTLEMELAVLKAEVKQNSDEKKVMYFRDLRGIAAEGPSPTEADFEAAKYSFKWEGEEMR